MNQFLSLQLSDNHQEFDPSLHFFQNIVENIRAHQKLPLIADVDKRHEESNNSPNNHE